MLFIIRSISSLAIVVLALSGGLHAANSPYSAGAASVIITPEASMHMAGYASRTRPAEGKLTELWAKALVMQDEQGERLALITLDLVGIDRQSSKSICDELQRRYDFSRSQIAICTSHTHTGPVVGMNLAPMHYHLLPEDGRELVDAYGKTLQDRVVSVVGQAIDKMAPCKLSWGSGKATFAVNRRNNPASEVPERREEGQLVGPVDHDVPVLTVKSTEGELRAIVFGYACHATVLSFYQWSGDYPGFAQIELESRHPDCVAMFWAGCGADQNPLPRRTVELAREYGKRLANAVDDVLDDMNEVEGPLDSVYREIDLPLGKLPTKEEVQEDTQSKNRYIAARAEMLLAKLKAGPLSQTYPYPVQTWKIGNEIEWIFLGGEVVVDYALRLKTERRGERTWVAGYANDVMAYIASRRVLREGGYEGGGAMIYYGLPTVWSPEIENLIVNEANRQTDIAQGR